MEAFEIAKRDSKLNEVLFDHKVSKINNPAMVGRLTALINEYRLLSRKKYEVFDTQGDYSR